MSTTLVSLVRSRGRSRPVLRRAGVRTLQQAVELARDLARAAGDEYAALVAAHVDTLAQRYAPPAKVHGQPGGRRERQLPVGDRT